MILPFSRETPQLTLEPVEACGGMFKDWYEMRLGDLVIVRIQCWSDRDDPTVWELYLPGRDAYAVDGSPPCADPVSAAHWYFDHKIKGIPA